MPFDFIELCLRLVGAFYAFGGYVATRATLTGYFIDYAIAAIAARKPSRRELAQTYWLLAAACLIFAGGLALLLLLDVAKWLFLASALGQAVYLFHLAPRYFDVEDPPDPGGRKSSTNAFVVYVAATAFVLWAASRGRLLGWDEVPWPLLALAGVVFVGHVGYVVATLAKVGGRGATPFPDASGVDDVPGRDPSQSQRVKVMAEYGAHPLWALDADVFGDFPPQDLGLSPELTRDLNAWADAYTASFDADDPAASRWTDAEHAAHAAEARPLAERLARERPDLQVYVHDGDTGVVEVKVDHS